MEKFKTCQLEEGYVLTTDHQIAGKGQRGNLWESQKGENLLFSFILFPDFISLDSQFYLNVFVSLAVVEGLQHMGIKEVSIKWPNDIYIKDKKVAGILIENIVKGEQLATSVVGVGLNVNQVDLKTLPHATSLKYVLGNEVDREQLLKQLCGKLDTYYKALQNNPEALLEEYKEKLLGWRQKRKFMTDTIWDGEIVDVQKNGLIHIRIDQSISTFGFKEVQFIL